VLRRGLELGQEQQERIQGRADFAFSCYFDRFSNVIFAILAVVSSEVSSIATAKPVDDASSLRRKRNNEGFRSKNSSAVGAELPPASFLSASTSRNTTAEKSIMEELRRAQREDRNPRIASCTRDGTNRFNSGPTKES
jgi:hypothetical protein